MKVKTSLVLGIMASLMLVSTNMVFGEGQSEENAAATTPAATETEGALPQAPSGPETQWVWGQVISVDRLNGAITLKYLDYETDQEKQIAIQVDDKTTYENVKSLGEINAGNTLSIDYIASPEGKNIAKNVSLEKPEEIQPMPQEGVPSAGTEGTSQEQETTPESGY